MKRFISIIVIAVMLLSVTVGCGGKTATDNKETSQTETTVKTSEGSTTAKEETAQKPSEKVIEGKITVINNRVDQVEDLNKIASAFHAKYPQAEATFEVIKDWGSAEKTRLAANAAPDVLFVAGSVMTQAQYPDFLLPIDELYTKDTISNYDRYKSGDHIYGYADGVNVTGLLYSKTTLKSVGVTSPPKTLDELFADFDKLKAKGIIPIGCMAKTLWAMSNWGTVRNVYETKTGDDYYNQYANTDTPFTKDNPIGKMLAFVKMLKDKGYFDDNAASSDWDVLRLQMDKVGFLMQANFGISALTNNSPEDVGFCPLPVDNSGKTYSTRSPSMGLGINKDTKYPDTAKAFIKFLLEESVYNDLCGTLPSVAGVKSNTPQLSEFMDLKPVYFDAPGATQNYNDIINKAQMNGGFGDLIQEVMITGDIDAVLAKYNKKWTDARAALGVK
ncbi:MAG: extracellular solute-binding protein [Clostridiaceae bacterium]